MKFDLETVMTNAAYITATTFLGGVCACVVIIVYMFAAYAFTGVSW